MNVELSPKAAKHKPAW